MADYFQLKLLLEYIIIIIIIIIMLCAVFPLEGVLL